MLKLTNPRLRRSNVVLNSFGSCISNTPKKLSRTPEMSISKMVSQPRMFFHQTKGTIAFKQLQSLADTHSNRHLNKEVDMVNSDVEFINFEPFSVGNLSQEKLAIHSKSIELEGIFGIFNFPDKMESILSEAVFKTFQIHFLSPQNIAHAKSGNLVQEGRIHPPDINKNQELNLMEDGNSSLCLKAQVSLPWM
jgi:hypothetical protein